MTAPQEEMVVDNIMYLTTTRIKFPNERGHGTGFFYNRGGKSYIITNRHVVKDDDHEPSEMRFFVRGGADLGEIAWIDKDISDGEGTDWYSDSNYSADIAVVPIQQRISTQEDLPDPITGSIALTSDNLIENPDRIKGGDSAFIAGYPGEFIDTQTYFPALRNAKIASPYKIPFRGKPLFITDARMHPGTSGSPVFADPRALMYQGNSIRIGGWEIILLGIHSSTYKQSDAEDPGGIWLDLNAAWDANLIEDILASV